MKVLFVLAVLAAFAQQPRDAVDVRPAPAGTSQLSGVVTLDDPGAAPVRLAIVTLSGEALALSRTVVTDDDGRFTFADLPAGRYSLSAKKAAYVTTFFGSKRAGRTGTLITVRAGERLTGVPLKMAKGAVITGTIRDADGAPAREIQVMAIRVGDPGLDPLPGPFAPTPVTDDRGVYRIFGLSPGEYVVVAAGASLGGGDGMLRSAAEIDAVLQRLQQRSRLVAPAAPPVPVQTLPPPAYGYVPVYFPGTVQSGEASRLRLVAGEERTGVDFTVRLLPAVSIEGVVTASDDSVPQISMSITQTNQIARPNPAFGMVPRLSQPPDRTGRFLYTGVPPGRYVITARSTGAPASPAPSLAGGAGGFFTSGGSAGPAATSWAMVDVTTSAENVSGLRLTLQPTLRLAGRVRFDPPAEINPTTLRVLLQRVDVSYSSNFSGTLMGGLSPPAAAPKADGTFEITGVLPGTYRMTSTVPGAAGWWLRSAVVGSRDVLDFPIEMGTGGDVGGAELTFSNRHSEVSGTLTAGAGAAASDYVVLVFPADRAYWRAGSRRVKSARPATDGEFTIADLPAGEYLIGALTDLEPGDADSSAFLEQLVSASLKFTLSDGERKRQDIRLK